MTECSTDEKKLPKICRWSFTVFRLVTSYTLCAISLFLLPILGYVFDSYARQPEFLEKSGAFIVMLGFLLTIKYRVVMSSETYTKYRRGIKGVGPTESSHSDNLEYDKTMIVVKTEVLGIWSILLGSLLSIFGSYIPLVDFCK